jgi:hypothetical protein
VRWRAGHASSQACRPDVEGDRDAEERLSVQSQIALLDEAAIALKDGRLSLRLARDLDPRALALLSSSWASRLKGGEGPARVKMIMLFRHAGVLSVAVR